MFNRDDNRGHDAPRGNDFTGEWECSKCHAKTPHTLPFTPSGDRPIYCKDCYKEMRKEQGR